MSHKKSALNLLAFALSASLTSAAFASQPAPTSMGPAPVTAAPQAAALGDAQMLTVPAKSTKRAVSLIAPSRAVLDKFKARRSASNQLKTLSIGFGRKVERSRIELGALAWEPQQDGSSAARFVVASDGAKALRAQLALKATHGARADAASVSLRFAGSDGRVFAENASAFAAGAGWSPIVSGDSMTIEIQLPKGVSPESYRLDVPALSHLVFDPLTDREDIGKSFGDIGTSGACEQDIVCRANPTPGFIAASNAVAHIAVTRGTGDTGWCTGTLLNNSKTPKRALLWTAAHCVADQAQASSFVTYWFFDATACNSRKASARTVVLSGGTTLLYRDRPSDVTLLELKAAPPAGAFYAGWSSQAIATVGTLAEGIHHPAGDLKKYSLAKVTSLSGQQTIGGVLTKPVTTASWTGSGVTEGGSSGSGLFTIDASGNYLLRGGLSGGPSSCSASTANKKDYYSQLSFAWPKISQFFSP